MTPDIEQLRSWIGRTQTMHDHASLAPLRALAATLDHDGAPGIGDAIPPCWHWLYFLPVQRQSEIGSDGHPRLGDFLPPVSLPRRMWAGSQIEFHAPLRTDQSLARLSRINDVRIKEGRSGPLVFVNVQHEIRADGELTILERHDIVYREMARPHDTVLAAVPAAITHQWKRRIEPDEVLLFRYSALTFNGHRIHYDRKYATEREGYPGLIVHGPLIATLLLELLRRERPNATVQRFDFRAVSPLFDTAAFDVCGKLTNDDTVKLWAIDTEGHLAMEATATITGN